MGASVACLAEVWSLAAVACDRFRAVYYPLERGKRLTKLQVVKRGFRNSNINCMFFYTSLSRLSILKFVYDNISGKIHYHIHLDYCNYFLYIAAFWLEQFCVRGKYKLAFVR